MNETIVTALDKPLAYSALVAERKKCRLCEGCGLVNPVNVEGGFDSQQVGPWSRWQGNLDAPLMVIGQDWGDVRYFKTNYGLENASNPTNKTLRELIGLLGIDVGDPGDLGQDGVEFFTNAILCLKNDGGLQAAVQRSWFDNCKPFLKRQIEIVAPRILICLGERAYRSVAAAFDFHAGSFRQAVESEDGIQIPNGTRVFPRYHCGRRILNTHRPMAIQIADWQRLTKHL